MCGVNLSAWGGSSRSDDKVTLRLARDAASLRVMLVVWGCVDQLLKSSDTFRPFVGVDFDEKLHVN